MEYTKTKLRVTEEPSFYTRSLSRFKPLVIEMGKLTTPREKVWEGARERCEAQDGGA
jgi:hypothetical protein